MLQKRIFDDMKKVFFVDKKNYFLYIFKKVILLNTKFPSVENKIYFQIDRNASESSLRYRSSYIFDTFAKK